MAQEHTHTDVLVQKFQCLEFCLWSFIYVFLNPIGDTGNLLFWGGGGFCVVQIGTVMSQVGRDGTSG